MYTRMVSGRLYLVYMAKLADKGYRQKVVYKFEKTDDISSIYEQLQQLYPDLNWNLTAAKIKRDFKKVRRPKKRYFQRKRKLKRLLNEADLIAKEIGSTIHDFLDVKQKVLGG